MRILLRGPFRKADLTLLAEALRAIERRQPQETFEMLMADAGPAADAAEDLLLEVFPFMKDAPVEIKIWKAGKPND